MKVICAPDSFKESLGAKAAAEAMARGVLKALPNADVDCCPISDGGEGFVDAMVAAMNGTLHQTRVRGPLPEQWVDASYGIVEVDADAGNNTSTRIAVIEMASAAGLHLVPVEQRDPTRTTTYGVGQLIAKAGNVDQWLIGIGGSATNDGGCGMAQAQGCVFMCEDGSPVCEVITGGILHRIHRVSVTELHVNIASRKIVVACDVNNPLCGPNGAAHVYGPQKGATPKQVEMLDQGLLHLSRIVLNQLGIDHANTPGAGAAGGMGYGLLAFCGATLKSGIELVLDAVRFNDRLRGADLVLTGEGKLDGQSLEGKACMGVVQRAKAQGVPTIALVGAAGDDVERAVDAGLDSYCIIGEGLPVQESMRNAAALIEAATERVCRKRFAST